MNVVDELKNLDVNDVGRWPLVFRVAVICIVFVVVLGMGMIVVCPANISELRKKSRRCASPSKTNKRKQQTTIPTKHNWRKWSSLSAPCCGNFRVKQRFPA